MWRIRLTGLGKRWRWKLSKDIYREETRRSEPTETNITQRLWRRPFKGCSAGQKAFPYISLFLTNTCSIIQRPTRMGSNLSSIGKRSILDLNLPCESYRRLSTATRILRVRDMQSR